MAYGLYVSTTYALRPFSQIRIMHCFLQCAAMQDSRARDSGPVYPRATLRLLSFNSSSPPSTPQFQWNAVAQRTALKGRSELSYFI